MTLKPTSFGLLVRIVEWDFQAKVNSLNKTNTGAVIRLFIL